MNPEKIQIIYADPPWSYRGRKQFGFAGDVGVDSGGAIKHYKTMSLDDICDFGIQDFVDDDALLFIWIPGPLLPDGLKVIEAWGFTYARDAFVWNKVVTNPGYYTLSQIETCYVAKRGRIPQPRGSRKERQYLYTEEATGLDYEQYIEQRRGRHSEKPDTIAMRIRCMFPTQNKIELFARKERENWICFGDEI